MPLIRSLSGLRATVADCLSDAVVHRHALAFAQMCPQGTIVVGRDGRPSGLNVQRWCIEALRSVGRDVILVDLATTPTIQLAIEHFSAAGGISVTASHNPAEWNGLKFIGSDGVFLSPEAATTLYATADTISIGAIPPSAPGMVQVLTSANQMHIAAVFAAVASLADDCSILIPPAKGETVVVDAVHASGSVIVPDMLRQLGYNVVELYCDSSGVFPHTPEPLPEHLTALAEATASNNAAFGVAVDPDGDRLVLFDESGKPIGEERTIALACQAVYSMGAQGACVVNYSTTRVVDDVAASFGQPCYRSAVGEINVVQTMRNVNAIIGGEGSGGVILPRCHAGRDSLVGIALISAYLRINACTLSQAVARLPVYSMQKTRIDAISFHHTSAILDAVQTELAQGALVNTDDGVHLAWSDRWLHVRASNTEPIMRIIAEAPDAESTQSLIDSVSAIASRLQPA